MEEKYSVDISGLAMQNKDLFELTPEYALINNPEGDGLILYSSVGEFTRENIPSLITRAFEFSLPDRVLRFECNNPKYEYWWSKRILYSFYTDTSFHNEGIKLLNQGLLDHISFWLKNLIHYNSNENTDKKTSAWGFAYNEYIGSLDAISMEVAYMNLTSVLEALLVEGNSELSYRVALHTAMCYDDYAKMKSVFNAVKNAYGIRSAAVHGDVKALLKKLKGNECFRSFLEFREIVAYILFLTYGKSKKDIIEEIESKIFK